MKLRAGSRRFPNLVQNSRSSIGRCGAANSRFFRFGVVKICQATSCGRSRFQRLSLRNDLLTIIVSKEIVPSGSGKEHGRALLPPSQRQPARSKRWLKLEFSFETTGKKRERSLPTDPIWSVCG